MTTSKERGGGVVSRTSKKHHQRIFSSLLSVLCVPRTFVLLSLWLHLSLSLALFLCSIHRPYSSGYFKYSAWFQQRVPVVIHTIFQITLLLNTFHLALYALVFFSVLPRLSGGCGYWQLLLHFGGSNFGIKRSQLKCHVYRPIFQFTTFINTLSL